MPTPRLSTQRVAPAPRPNLLGPVPGQEAAAITGAVAQVADVFAKEVQRIDDLRVSEAELAFRNKVRTAYEDPKDGFTTKRGTDAIAGLDGFREQLRSAASEVEAGLTSENQRMLFRRRAAQLQADADAQAGRYVRQETERVQAETYEALNAADLETIAGAPENADAIIAAMDERTAIFADDMGKSPEVMAQARAQVRSNARLAQVEALAASDPIRAKEVLEANIEQIAPSERQKARDYVESAGLLVRSQRIADDLYDAFKTDEAAAIREAERTYEGKERDAIVQRIEVAFARQRRLAQEEVKSYTDAAMNDAYAGRPVSRATQAWLSSNGQSKVLRAAEAVQLSVVRGEPVQTDFRAYQELSDLLLPENRAKFLETNLLEYADRLSDSDMRGFINAQTQLRGGSRTASQGVQTSYVLTEMFTQAKGSGFFRENVKRMGDVELYPEDKEIFNVLRGQVEANIAAAQAKQGGELSGPQVRQIIRETLDGQILDTVDPGPFSLERRVVVPDSAASPDARIRRRITQAGGTPTAAKVAAIRALEGRTDLTPAQKIAEAERIARGQ